MKSIFLILGLLITNSLYSQYQFADIYESNPDVANCEEGALLESEKQKVLQAINLIRQAHGLKPVTYDYSKDEDAQKGALISAANNALSHTPESNWECWSQAGYDGNENSNLYWSTFGAPTYLPDSYISILGWMIDQDVPNLGHRRAIINPFIDKIAFGRVDGFSKKNPQLFNIGMNLYYRSSYNNTYSSSELEYVAYPQGNYPIQLVDKSWFLSFHAIYDTQKWWNNSNVDYSAAEVIVMDEDGELSVSEIGYDNDGWGSLPNQIRWKVSGLQDYVEYTVQINNVNVNGTNKNYEYTFTLGGTAEEAPEVPTLTYPSDEESEVETTLTLDWDDVDNATVYALQVASDISFSDLLVEENTLSNSEYLLEDLEEGTQYFWQVAAINANGSSGWSNPRSFTTDFPAPDSPTLMSPENGSNIEVFEPNFTWEFKNNYTSFTLIVATNNQFTRNGTVLETEVEGTEYKIDNTLLSNDDTYYWRVKTNYNGKESNWSSIYQFTTPALPEKPISLDPDNGVFLSIDEAINFSWAEVDGANEYRFQLADNEEVDMPMIDTILSNNSFLYENFELGITYYWRVQAQNTGKGGTWSDPAFFATAPTDISDHLIKIIDLTIQKNPINDNLKFSFNNLDVKQVILTDINGEIIIRNYQIRNGLNDFNFDLSMYSNGSYYLILDTKQGKISKLIIKN